MKCSWCNGFGFDLAYKGANSAPRCTRCGGSGNAPDTPVSYNDPRVPQLEARVRALEAQVQDLRNSVEK